VASLLNDEVGVASSSTATATATISDTDTRTAVGAIVRTDEAIDKVMNEYATHFQDRHGMAERIALLGHSHQY
jgi:ribosomal protein L17